MNSRTLLALGLSFFSSVIYADVTIKRDLSAARVFETSVLGHGGNRHPINLLVINGISSYLLQRPLSADSYEYIDFNDDGTGIESVQDVTLTPNDRTNLDTYGAVVGGPLAYIEEVRDKSQQYLVIAGMRKYQRTKYTVMGTSTGTWNAWEKMAAKSSPDPKNALKITDLKNEGVSLEAFSESEPVYSSNEIPGTVPSGVTIVSFEEFTSKAVAEWKKMVSAAAAPTKVDSAKEKDVMETVLPTPASASSVADTRAGDVALETAKAVTDALEAFAVTQASGKGKLAAVVATLEAQVGKSNTQLESAIARLESAVSEKLSLIATLQSVQGTQGKELDQIREQLASSEAAVAAAEAAATAAKAEHEEQLQTLQSTRAQLQKDLENAKREGSAEAEKLKAQAVTQAAQIEQLATAITAMATVKERLQAQESEQQEYTATIEDRVQALGGQRDKFQGIITDLTERLSADDDSDGVESTTSESTLSAKSEGDSELDDAISIV